MKIHYLLFVIVLLGIGLSLGCQQKIPTPGKLEILFLGHDSKHHNSAEYLPMLKRALAPKGFNFNYTEQLADLNEDNLSHYDALMIYANHDSIAPAQEKALLNFVKAGGGLLPIHCASYCFRNSEEYVKLVGAQFKSHGTGTFSPTVINANHPITKGFETFEAWDETYVHDKHTDDRTLLMERIEGDHREPWTWTKEYGNGRMFYTASGHDERVWSHPGFHSLLERGILWAVGDLAKAEWEMNEIPVLAYVQEDSIPNYEKRDPPPKLQQPLDPVASMKHLQLPPGFKIDLFASEPDIINPIAMAWDERGRLWVIETADYPNNIITEDGIGNDKIKIVEDTNGDGKADKFTVFADKLSVPTSLVFSNGGIIVSQAPHFLFLKDTDGDGKADLRQKIVSGWGTFDTHAGPSNLKYGFDNQIWGVLGYSGFEGTVGDEEHKFAQGVYRFQPDGSKLELITNTTNNTWGLGFSETNDIFGSTANNEHAFYVGIPNRYYAGIKGLPEVGSGCKKIDGHYAMHTNTPNYRQVDVFGGFTAAAGFNLYTARSFPKEYWNQAALVCEPTGHLLHWAKLEKDGAGFKEKDGWNLLASSDEWVSPVHAEVGPDGSVWILDWYNFIIQHNPTPKGFQNGKGNAHINRNRDYQHGRIYRVTYKNGKASDQPDLSNNTPTLLVKALGNDNMLWRMHGQRLLVERGNSDVMDELIALVGNTSVDELGQNNAALHALWTMHGLNAFDGLAPTAASGSQNEKALQTAMNALRHPAAAVRKAAIQVLPKGEKLLNQMLVNNMANDENQHTRLAAILALSEMEDDPNVGALLYALSQYDDIQRDSWLSQAVYMASAKHRAGFLHALRNDPALKDQNVAGVIDPDKNWYKPNWDDSDWRTIKLPGNWDQEGFEDLYRFDGTIWHRKEVEMSAADAASAKLISLGPIDEIDSTWINGVMIGSTIGRDPERKYNIPKGLLKAGKNQITVKVTDIKWGGGFYGKENQMYIESANDILPLAGSWKLKIGRIIRSTIPHFVQHKIADEFLKYYEKGTKVAPQVSASTQKDPNVNYVYLKTIREQMQYDKKEFTVKAGETVEIVFENNDAMQHNLLIISPGRLQDLGAAADKMATSIDAVELDYVPPMSYVLHHTKLVNPGQTVRLRFTAPGEPGDYPYVCTFPGHWKMMNGVMKVQEQVSSASSNETR